MPDRPALLTETLLRLHSQPDARALLHTVAHALAPLYGPAFACAYLHDAARDGFYLDSVASAGSDAPSRPPLVADAPTMAALLQPVAAGAVAHQIAPPFAELRRLWGDDGERYLAELAMMRVAVAAPVACGEHMAGAVILLGGDGWDAAVLAECAAHVALALGRFVGQRAGAGAAADLFMRGVLEQVAAREITRAERYKRALSLTVIELPETGQSRSGLTLAALIARVMRQPDIAGRLDGRRMAVILPETPASGAAAFIRRLRKQAGPELAEMRAAAASLPQDGRTWNTLVDAALGRLARAETVEEPAERVVTGAPRRAPDLNDAPAEGAVRVQVTPLAENEVGSWHGLLGRTAVIESVTLEGYDGHTATYALHTGSPARVFSYLRQLAKTMNATYNLAVGGDVGLALRTGEANGRAHLAGRAFGL